MLYPFTGFSKDELTINNMIYTYASGNCTSSDTPYLLQDFADDVQNLFTKVGQIKSLTCKASDKKCFP